MAKKLAFNRISVHKYSHKNPIQMLRMALNTGLTLALVAMPAQTLAFEAQLPSAASQKLIASVQLAENYDNGVVMARQQLPDYSHGASSVTAYPPITTTPGEWKDSRHLVLSQPAATPVRAALPLVLEGEASYYSRAGCLGCSPALTMANGQPLNDNALTMAIAADRKHLVGHTATITSLVTGKTVDVLITDTGGFYQERYGNRVADLTIATKQAIGMVGGVGQVRVVVH